MSTQTFTPEAAYPSVAEKRLDTASALRPDFKVIQPTTTYTGAIQKGLPKITESLC